MESRGIHLVSNVKAVLVWSDPEVLKNLTDIFYADHPYWHLFAHSIHPNIDLPPACVQILYNVVYQTWIILTQRNYLFMAL